MLIFLNNFLDGRARRAPTGVHLCARLLESRTTDKRDDPELEAYLLGRRDTEVQSSAVLESYLVVVALRKELQVTGRLDLSYFLLQVRFLGVRC